MSKGESDSTRIVREIELLSTEEKSKIYQSCFSIGYFGGDNLNDVLILISLLTLTYKKLKEKDKTLTPLKLLLKITGQKEDSSAFYSFLESLSFFIEDISYNAKKIDSCGLNTSQEIINKIKEILNTWIPF